MHNNSTFPSDSSSTADAPPGVAMTSRKDMPQQWALPLLTRLHFYVGLLVAPLLLIAAFSGALYALTPQIEDAVYEHALYTPATGTPLALKDQIDAAAHLIGGNMRIAAVRPAPAPGTTTRVMYSGPGMGPSEYRAIFIDPITAQVRGDLNVYGTSGVLPIRAWLDQFHRSLHLGDAGRLYSELAASWLWIVALGGLVLWVAKFRRQRLASNRPAVTYAGPRRHRVRDWHGTLGLWVLIGLLFFSATGLTWSQWAGGNISVLRTYYGWGTPSLATGLGNASVVVPGMHAHHEHQAPMQSAGNAYESTMFDAVLATARKAGIDAGKLEIRPPANPDKAWTVTEIDRSWPTQVDAVAIDPRNLAIIDQTRFADFPIAAKLTRWGIDAHMGALFGLANQLVLIFFAGGLVTMTVWGYMMWWRRRPTRNMARDSHGSLLALLGKAPRAARAAIAAGAALAGWFLPLMGISLLLFLLFDICLRRYSAARPIR